MPRSGQRLVSTPGARWLRSAMQRLPSWQPVSSSWQQSYMIPPDERLGGRRSLFRLDVSFSQPAPVRSLCVPTICSSLPLSGAEEPSQRGHWSVVPGFPSFGLLLISGSSP